MFAFNASLRLKVIRVFDHLVVLLLRITGDNWPNGYGNASQAQYPHCKSCLGRFVSWALHRHPGCNNVGRSVEEKGGLENETDPHSDQGRELRTVEVVTFYPKSLHEVWDLL